MSPNEKQTPPLMNTHQADPTEEVPEDPEKMNLRKQASSYRKQSQTEILSRTLANKETKLLKLLRAAVLFSLFMTAAIIFVLAGFQLGRRQYCLVLGIAKPSSLILIV